MVYQSYDRPPNVEAYNYGRPLFDLPKPLEPRPSLHTSLSDTTGAQRRPDALHGSVLPETRAHRRNLPGLRDILNDSPTSNAAQPQTQWHPQARPGPYSQNSDGQLPNHAIHPPMAIHPPHLRTQQYQTHPARAFEVPVLEPSRPSRMPPQPGSPYAGPPNSGCDYPRSIPETTNHATAGQYLRNGVSSPYIPHGVDEVHYAVTQPAFERPADMPLAPPGTENQKYYLGTKEIPGEGMFHLYEGGFRIPTHVDGEQVNPAWGLTKANKPRKRLALACLDCREKKIKCEPGVQSCLQCEKAKRPCRRAPGQNSQMVVAWQDASNSPARSQSTSDPTPTMSHSIQQDHVNKRRVRADPSPPNVPSKKHRSTSPVAALSEPAQPAPEPVASQAAQKSMMTLEDDPYEVDPEMTIHLLELYFTHMNCGVYWLYPRRFFMRWVKTSHQKCQNERMVLHAMLAAASIYSPDVALAFGKQCARIAGDAIQMQIGKFNIATAHTRMLLAHFHFARGSLNVPWEHVGAAMRTITYMQLHTETGCLDARTSQTQPRVEFNFSLEQLAECKRRTFWSIFLMDRLSGPTTCVMKPEDIFVRLPCSDEAYEQGIASEAPLYPNENVDCASTLLTPASPVAPVAWLVLVAGIWGDINDFLFRMRYRPASTYRQCYEQFYNDAHNRLQGWVTRLPAHLQYGEETLHQSIQHGYAEAFVTMHSMYHLALMKLNQTLRHEAMPDVVSRNIRQANSHAQRQLSMMGAVRVADRSVVVDGCQTQYAFTTPFIGYATLTAINIISAGGPESSLQPSLALVEGGLFLLRELANYWSCAKEQLRVCERRYYEIEATLKNPKSRSGAWLGKRWGLAAPIQGEDELADDCIYGLGQDNDAFELYFHAFEDSTRSHRALRLA